MNKFYLLSLIGKYGVRLLHHTAGEVTVEIGAWEAYEEKLQAVVAYLKKEPAVHSIEVTGRVVRLQFEPEVLKDERQVQELYRLIKHFDL